MPAIHHLLAISITALQAAEKPVSLHVGEPVEGRITDDDSVLGTERLADEDPLRPPVGKTYRLEVEEAGPVTLELRSDFFDAYLVVRDEWGEVLAEDDDGLFPTDARIVLDLGAGTFLVDAVALRGGRGAFELGASASETFSSGVAGGESAIEAVKAILDFAPAEHVWRLRDLADEWKGQGRYAEAQSLYERVLRIRERVSGPEHPLTASALSRLGVLLNSSGLFSEARELQERALEIRHEALGPEHPDTLLSLNNLAMSLAGLGLANEARPLYERAIRTLERTLGSDHPNLAMPLMNLAIMLNELGLNDDALRLHERSLQIREKAHGADHPRVALNLNNLGVVYGQTGRLEEARECLERSVRIRERALGTSHPETATSLINLAECLDDLGLPDEARPLHERAVAIWTETLGPMSYFTAMSINNLAEHLAAQGAVDEARARYGDSIEILTTTLGPEHPDTAHVQRNLALLHADGGDLDQAWELVLGAQRESVSRLARVLSGFREAEGFAYATKLRMHLELLLSLSALLDDGARARLAYEELLAWKGRVTRLIEAGRARIFARFSPEEKALLDELRSVQGSLSALLFRTDVSDPAAHQGELDRLRKRRDELELRWQRLSGTGEERKTTFDSLQAALAPGTVALDFLVHRTYRPGRCERGRLVEAGSWSEPRLSVWITGRASEVPLLVDLGQAAPIELAMAGFLRDLVARRGLARESDAESEAGAELRGLLWDPIAPHLDGVEAVVVSPDGFLGTLPFEVLPDGEGGFLVERFAFAYRSDLASLVDERKTTDGELRSALVAGGLDFRRRAEPEQGEGSGEDPARTTHLRGSFAEYWAPLPHTAYEAEVVRALHEDSFPDGSHLHLTGPEATEERLKTELPRHALAHLATHGFFQPEGLANMWEEAQKESGGRELRLREGARRIVGHHPALLSGLVCSGANEPASPTAPTSDARDDGFLTAEEVGWLDLSGVELVVLSACETALGRPQSGEGMLGLRRAFHTAGAKTVVSSLWSVKDESTSELMQAFYRNLWTRGPRTIGRLEALRAAQLAMLKRNRIEHGAPLPSTWGAFVLSGEWR